MLNELLNITLNHIYMQLLCKYRKNWIKLESAVLILTTVVHW